jgi:hypothetical protein
MCLLMKIATSTINQPPNDVKSLLLPKYETINNPIVSEFISSVPSSLEDSAYRITHSPAHLFPKSDRIIDNRIELQKAIDKYQSQAGTLTAGVSDSLMFLDNPTTKIFVSIHQPNLFAYSGVFKKIVLLQSLKNLIERQEGRNRVKIVNLFLIVDHDFIDEIWIRLAQLPSVRHSLGRLELRLPISISDRWKMVCNVPKPRKTVLEYWREQICLWIMKNSASYKATKLNMLDKFEQFWREVEFSYSKAKSYSDFNSFLMSRIVNKVWNYDTLFVRLTDLSTAFEDGFRYLMDNFIGYSDSLRKAESMILSHNIDARVSSNTYLNAPLWLHCECGSKASVKIQRMKEQKEETMLKGTCLSCKNNLQINISTETKGNEEAVFQQLSPRAIPILLLLTRDLGIECYASGTGGVDYMVVGSLVFNKLSINMPLVLLWPSRDDYYGIGQSEALQSIQLTQKSDVLPYLESLKQKEAEYMNKIEPIIEERTDRIKAGMSIDVLLSELFRLKKDQRKIRQLIKVASKVKNAVYMSPCFVDYAVNVGMAETEVQWREHLSKNDNLAAPIHMTRSNL